MHQAYIKIKDLEIPISIKSYKNAKSIKIYFKGNILTITKPTILSKKKLLETIKLNEEDIYGKYKKIVASEISSIKQWANGEKIYYKGEQYTIIHKNSANVRINIEIKETQKEMIITTPESVNKSILKTNIDKGIKKLFKKNTEVLISNKLPYWSKITQIDYNEVKVRDAITRYGSCMPSKKNLYFSSRLIMLPEDKVDAIIVHELCHMKHKNHNKEFYDLVAKYIPNYKEIDKWLKINGKIIMF